MVAIEDITDEPPVSASISDTPLPDGLTIEELTPEEELERQPCQIHGLKARPELNNSRAKTLLWDAAKQRMGVALPDGGRISCKLANLRFGDDMTDEPPPPADEEPRLYLSIAGSDCDALRPALEKHNLVHQVDVTPATTKAPKSMTSATPELSILQAAR